jgi:tRNA-dihydrouridine synthase
MDDVTDTVFRRIVGGCCPPDVYFTEFVNVDGLQSVGRNKLLKRLYFTNNENPLIAQIWGKNPENYYKTAKQIIDGTFAREMGLPAGTKYAGIDINMGCPDKAVLKNGCCAALIDNRALAGEIIKAVKRAVADTNPDFPISLKTRVGLKQVDLSWFEYLMQFKLNMLTVHGRTAKEMSKVPANWELIGEVRKMRDLLSPDTLIVGNGDVLSYEQGLELATQYQLDGIMIGRGIFHNPFVFQPKSTWENLSKSRRIEIYAKHVKLFAETWNKDNETFDTKRSVKTLNKFCKVYIQNFDGAKELREELMSSETTDQLLDILSK